MSDRTEWLERRRQHVCATDVAALIDIDRPAWVPSRWALWADKCGLIPIDDNGTSDAMEYGNRSEGMNARWFEDKTGLSVAGKQTFRVHRTDKIAAATLDGFVLEGPHSSIADALGPFESKATSDPPAAWAEAIPAWYQTQGQWLNYVTESDRCWFGVIHLAYGRPAHRIYELPRDEADIALLVAAAREFWALVESQTPPPVDGSQSTADAILGRWTEHDPGLTLTADDELIELLGRRAAIKARINADTGVVKELDNVLAATIGDHELIAVHGVPAWSYKTQGRDTVNGAALKSAHPELDLEPFTSTSRFRVLRTVKPPKGTL